VGLFPVTSSGSKPGQMGKHNINYKPIPIENAYGDSGSAARFFYCAKSSRREKGEGLDGAEIVMIQLTHNSQTIKKDGELWESPAQSLRLLVDTEQSTARVIGASTEMEDTEWSTLLFGNSTTAPLMTGSLFTIKTVTSSITESKTLKYLMRLLTSEYTVDVKSETGNGGSPAVSAGSSNQWQLSIMNEKTVYLPGVGSVASKTLWKISGSEDNAREGRVGQLNNFHSTVKPISLFKYLCTLTKTPDGGVVLDPFMGSGTTGIAAHLTGREFIGIEQNEEYFEIAKRRIEHWQAKPVQEELI
jgi:hypothetical protein